MKGRVRLLKAGVWAACLSPLAWIVYRFFLVDGLGANPIEALEHWSGDAAITTLLAALSVTPLRRLTGWNVLQKVRRLVGLFAFRYVGEDIAERPFILVGFTAFVLLIPMAVTSTKGWIRRLGKNWVRLHRLVYVSSVLGVVHFLWATKGDDRWPLVAAAAWAVLMLSRLPWKRLRARPTRREAPAPPAHAPRPRAPEVLSETG